jgi:hypothetical protein
VTYRGRVAGGVVVLEGGVQIPEGTPVLVEPIPVGAEIDPTSEDPLFRMGDLAAETGVTDLANDIDFHLYGHPRMSDGR